MQQNSSSLPLPRAYREAMLRAQGRRILLFSAPAGYGKTSFLSRWLREEKVASQWLALDSGDDALPRLCDDILTLMLRFQPGNLALAQIGARRGESPCDVLLSAASRLEDPPSPCALVLDDVHALRSEECVELLLQCVRRLPPSIRVFLLSNAPLYPQYIQLNVREEAALLTEQDFRLNEQDIRALCACAGAMLDDAQCAKVARESHGWLFAALAAIQREHGGADDAASLEYIEKAIWPMWPREEQDFLLRVSFLDTLYPALCDRLTGREDSAALLAGLASRNALIRPAGQNSWKIHDLLRAYLTEKSREALPPEGLRALYQAAAVWHFENADYHHATDYYVLGRDHAGLSSTIGTMSDREFENSVENLYLYARDHVALLPEGYVQDKPDLLAHRAWYFFLAGDAVGFTHAIDRLALLSRGNGDPSPLFRDILLFIPVLDFRLSMQEIAQRLSRLAEASSPREKPPYINTITHNLPYAHRSMRDFTDVASLSEGDFSLFRSSYGKMIGWEYDVLELCLMAGLSYEKSELAAAYRHALAAYEALTSRHAAEYHFCTLMLLQRILRAMGREENARDIFEEGRRLADNPRGAHFRMNLAACEIDSLRAEPEAAERWLKLSASSAAQALSFYRIAQHFATVRALMITGQPQRAILDCRRLRRLFTDYQRPLDIAEVSILMAIAHWSVGDIFMAQDALRDAFAIAQEHRYTQMFVDYQREVRPIFLHMRQAGGADSISPLFLCEVAGIVLSGADDLNEQLSQ